MSLSRYYHTIKYLKMEQIYFQIYYKGCARLRALFAIKEKYNFYKNGNHLKFISLPRKRNSYKGDNIFEFLNLTHRFVGVWDDCSLGDLWRYNLNYMDFILQPSMNFTEGVEWIERFINDISYNKSATDPYPISLRGINWIKFVSLYWDKLSDEQHRDIDTSLYSQYRILYRRTERHLLANHYLEDGFSLLFAAVYFNDKTFWKKAKRIVSHQLNEQILADGAHYELSPMYHCIILERLLDCYNLLCGVDGKSFDGFLTLRNLCAEKASHMLSWLESIVVSGDRMPLLNDSANGVALQPDQLREYAGLLGLQWECAPLSDCGYRHVVRTDYEAILDMAPLGVSYNLGHAHADSSTFLIWAKGRELLVDTGTSTYNAGCRRDYERSTRAHNTVVIDSENSSKVWGAFRCAQRANLVVEDDGPECFTLWHDGYSDKGIGYRRSFLCKNDTMEVVDVVEGNVSSIADAYFHLSPDVKIISVENNRVVTDRAVFIFNGQASIQLIKEEIAKEYNVLQPTVCIQVTFSNRLHTIIGEFK